MATTENIAYLRDIEDTATVPSSAVPGNIVAFGEHPRELSDSGKKISDFRLENDFSVGDGWILTLPDGKHVWLDRVSPDRLAWRSSDEKYMLVSSATWNLSVDGDNLEYEEHESDGSSFLVFRNADSGYGGSSPVYTYSVVRGSRIALDTDVSRLSGLIGRDSFYKIAYIEPDQTVVSTRKLRSIFTRDAFVGSSSSESSGYRTSYRLPNECFPIAYTASDTLIYFSLGASQVEYRYFEGYDYDSYPYQYVRQIRVSRSVDENGDRLPPDVGQNRVIAKFNAESLAYEGYGIDCAYSADPTFDGRFPELGVWPMLVVGEEDESVSSKSWSFDSSSSGQPYPSPTGSSSSDSSPSDQSSSSGESGGGGDSGEDSSSGQGPTQESSSSGSSGNPGSSPDSGSGESYESGSDSGEDSSSSIHTDIIASYTLLDRHVNVLRTEGDETMLRLKLPKPSSESGRLVVDLVIRVGFQFRTKIKFLDSDGETSSWYDGNPTGVFPAGNHVFRVLDVGDGLLHFTDESSIGVMKSEVEQIKASLRRLLNGNIFVKEHGNPRVLHQLFAVKDSDTGTVDVGTEQEGVPSEN